MDGKEKKAVSVLFHLIVHIPKGKCLNTIRNMTSIKSTWIEASR